LIKRRGRGHFAAEAGHGGFEQVRGVFLGELYALGDTIQLCYSHYARPIEAICDSYGMDAPI
jgi:hypothetical protein